MTATFQCQECKTLIDDAELEILRQELGSDEGESCPNCGSYDVDIAPHRSATIKRPDLWGAVNDTFQTEAELNGIRDSQGRLL
jgi:hypothetical protein